MKTENAIIIILIMIIVVATGIFTLGNINLHTDSGNDNSEISYDSSNSIDSGGSSQIEEPSQAAGESEDSGESVQESADSESN